MRTFLIVVLAAVALMYAALWHGKPVLDSFIAVELPTLLNHADQYDGRMVTVVGTLLPGGGIMGMGAYRVTQGDAEVLVFSSHGIPTAGKEVRVRGIFKQALAIGNRQVAIIVERQ